MKQATENYICPVCGRKEKPNKVYNNHFGKKTYIDGSLVDNILDDFYSCPECGYVSLGALTPVSDEIKKLIKSEEYIKNKDNTIKQIELINNISNEFNNYLFWLDRTKIDNLKKYLNKLEEEFTKRTPSLVEYLEYIDLLRESGDFSNAEKGIEELLKTPTLSSFCELYKLSLVEQELIKKRSIDPYIVGGNI